MILLALAAGGYWAARLLGPVVARSAARRAEGREDHGELVVLAELVLLGLSAGLTLGDAFDAATTHVSPVLRVEVGAVLRRARIVGMAAALDGGGGRAERLYRVAARAAASGAPLLQAVAAFVAEVRHAEHTRRVAAARRLPVRLLLPLALLILPGFVVLTLGPALLGVADRLRI